MSENRKFRNHTQTVQLTGCERSAESEAGDPPCVSAAVCLLANSFNRLFQSSLSIASSNCLFQSKPIRRLPIEEQHCEKSTNCSKNTNCSNKILNQLNSLHSFYKFSSTRRTARESLNTHTHREKNIEKKVHKTFYEPIVQNTQGELHCGTPLASVWGPFRVVRVCNQFSRPMVQPSAARVRWLYN